MRSKRRPLPAKRLRIRQIPRPILAKRLVGQFDKSFDQLSESRKAFVRSHLTLQMLWDRLSPAQRQSAAKQLDDQHPTNLVDRELLEDGFRKGLDSLQRPIREAKRRAHNKRIAQLPRPGAQQVSDEEILHAAEGRNCMEAYRWLEISRPMPTPRGWRKRWDKVVGRKKGT